MRKAASFLVPSVASVVACVAAVAVAQVPTGAPIEPERLVAAALGADRPVLRRVERYRGSAARTWTIPLRTARGQCYELLAIASSAAQVGAEVRVRASRVGEALALANSSGEVARTRFCATLPGNVYAVAVSADGAAHWSLALRTAPPPPPVQQAAPGEAQRDRLALALSYNAAGSADAGAAPDADPVVAPAVVHPVGGTENDYVANQIRAAVRGSGGARALTPATRVTLQTNQSHELRVPLHGGRCVRVVVAAVPSASDVDVEITDPAGNRVAQDSGHRGSEDVRYCPSYTGTYRITVRMFAGFGATGIQTFEAR